MKDSATKRIKVLVSGGGGDVANALIDCFSKSNLDLEVSIASSSESALFTYYADHHVLLPKVGTDRYVVSLIETLRNLSIDIFFPTIASEIALVAAHADEIQGRTGSMVFVGKKDLVETFSDKYATVNFLQAHNFPSPATVLLDESLNLKAFMELVGFPFIAKPRFGNGSKGVYKVRNEQDLAQVDGLSGYILQEMLPIAAGEFTAGIYVGLKQQVLGICVLKRLLDRGSTVVGQRILDSDLEIQLESIALQTKLPYVNIQFALKDNIVVPFEINPRFSGTTFMQSIAFNAPEIAIKEWVLGERLEASKNTISFSARRMNRIEFSYNPSDQLEILSW